MNVVSAEKKAIVNHKLKVADSISYPFVDLVRFISMMGIVWAHVDVYSTTSSLTVSPNLLSSTYMQYFIPYKQIFKFGVICFFIISGFLLGDKIEQTNSVTYFKRRVNSTFRPYLLALSVFLALILIRAYVYHRSITADNSFLGLLKFTLFDTLYWYLPNYLVSLSVLLVFKKYIRSLYLGGFFLIITLLYTIFQVYTYKHGSGHTLALFGYVFYLWLGTHIRQSNLAPKIQNLSTGWLVGAAIILYVLSSAEGYWLYQQKLFHFHILRLSNQLYSVAMFVLMVNVCRRKINFGFFNPRKESFGIYLYHGFFIYFIIPKFLVICKSYLNIDIYSYHTGTRLLLMTIYWVVCYLLTTLLVKALLKFKLAYL